MRFKRTIGIDYSGAETADSSLKGLRVFMTEAGGPAIEVLPPSGPRRYWTRRGLAGWLTDRLAEPVPTIAGVDHAFSFPDAYFARHGLPRDWDAFLGDFHAHWPTDQPKLYVDFLRHGRDEMAARRGGDRRWRRRVEEICRAKSVFHFDVTGEVAKSTHAGLPFLHQIRSTLPKLHVWPYDGWGVPDGASVLAEIYPRLWSADYPNDGRTPDQQDAFAAASWLRDADMGCGLAAALAPGLGDENRLLARHEGWILGVVAERAIGPRHAGSQAHWTPEQPRDDFSGLPQQERPSRGCRYGATGHRPQPAGLPPLLRCLWTVLWCQRIRHPFAPVASLRRGPAGADDLSKSRVASGAYWLPTSREAYVPSDTAVDTVANRWDTEFFALDADDSPLSS